MTMMEIGVIYCAILPSGKKYYGLSSNFEKRKEKISNSLIGKKRNPIMKRNILKLEKNTKKRCRVSPSKETREKISNSQIGRIFSDDHRKKLSESAKKRKRTPMTVETKEKIRLSCIATKNNK